MKVRREILKARTIILLAGAMAIVAGSATGAAAKDQKGMTPAQQGWYFHGGFDAGGRFYAERPGSGFGYDGWDPTATTHNFLLPTQTDSRAKYEEYGKVPPGVFLNWINLDIGSNDGRYRINFWGDNVGYNAQSYTLDFSEPGKQHLSLGWDQTPHLWSYSAKSLFGGVGTTNLTVANAVQNQLQALWGCASTSAACTPAQSLFNRQQINKIIDNNATHIDEISVRRDTFSAAYRITPVPGLDLNFSYAHEKRDGTKPGQLDYSYTTSKNPYQHVFASNTIGVPIPVDDTTQKPAASGEVSGVGAWGRYSFKLGYAGSIYHDNLSLLTVENPFSNTGHQTNFGTLLLETPVSNQAHAFTGNAAFDIPLFMSRFMTTFQYTRRTQNEPFRDTSNNGMTAEAMPVASLDGKVQTFLTNSVLTSTFTKNLHNKVRVRLYDFDNPTPNFEVPAVVVADSQLVHPGTYETEHLSYTKTNVDEDLTWTPAPWLTVGAGYGFEHWYRTNRFTTSTNEHTGRGFLNAQLTDWAQWRASYAYSSRRYSGEYAIDDGAWLNSRMFDLANRNRQKARTLLDIMVTDAISITPNAGLRWDDYPDDAINPAGVKSEHSWNAGVDVGFVVSPTLRFTAGYNFERDKLDMNAYVPDADYANGNGPNTCNFPANGYNVAFPAYTVPAGCGWNDKLTQTYHTLVARADWKVIPGTLDLRLNYAASWEREAHDFTPCTINSGNCNGLGSATAAQVNMPWPDNTNLFQRFDATVRYFFPKDVLAKMGWKGKVIAKARYTYEHNDGSYWQSDSLNAYFGNTTGTDYSGTTRSTFLAYDNPNYTVQMIAASLTFKW